MARAENKRSQTCWKSLSLPMTMETRYCNLDAISGLPDLPAPLFSFFGRHQRAYLTMGRLRSSGGLCGVAFAPFAATGLAGQKPSGRGPSKRMAPIPDGPWQRSTASGRRRICGHGYTTSLRICSSLGSAMSDLRARIGYYIIAAATLSPTGAHLAVEADPADAARLRRDLALDDIDAKILGVHRVGRAGKFTSTPPQQTQQLHGRRGLSSRPRRPAECIARWPNTTRPRDDNIQRHRR